MSKHPHQPQLQHQDPLTPGTGERKRVVTRRVDQVASLDELFTHCLPAFGGAYLRRIYPILDDAIGAGCPLTLAVAGPVTVSGQHQAWLIPLLETGWVAYLSTTDAVCYHDGHRSLDAYKIRPDPRGADLRRRRRAARREAPSASPTWRSTRTCCSTRTASSPPCLLRPEFQQQDDRHRAALPAGRHATPRRSSRTASRPGCSRPATGWPSRSSSARRATAACS